MSRTLSRTHSNTQLHALLAPRIDASCTSTASASLFALETSCPVFIHAFCWNASSFRKQVDSVKEHLTRTQTDPHAVIVCLWLAYLLTSKMLLWFGIYKSCHHSTAKTGQNWPKRSSPLQDPRKRLWFFFLLNQPLPAVWALETWWQHSAMSAGAG